MVSPEESEATQCKHITEERERERLQMNRVNMYFKISPLKTSPSEKKKFLKSTEHCILSAFTCLYFKIRAF